jgi:hypothetical protein
MRCMSRFVNEASTGNARVSSEPPTRSPADATQRLNSGNRCTGVFTGTRHPTSLRPQGAREGVPIGPPVARHPHDVLLIGVPVPTVGHPHAHSTSPVQVSGTLPTLRDLVVRRFGLALLQHQQPMPPPHSDATARHPRADRSDGRQLWPRSAKSWPPPQQTGSRQYVTGSTSANTGSAPTRADRSRRFPHSRRPAR